MEAINRELREEITVTPKNIVFLGKQIFADGSEVSRYLVPLTEEEYTSVKLGDEGQRLDFFSMDEITNLELAGYSKEYFSEFRYQIKEIVEEGNSPKPKLLGLTV